MKHEFYVKTADISVEPGLHSYHRIYFNILEQCVPVEKRGNFYSIGNDVLRNHCLAYLNRIGKTPEPIQDSRFTRLVKSLVYHTFFATIDDHWVKELNKVIEDFFAALESYLLDLLEIEKPSVLGLSVTSDTLPASLFAFQAVKEKYPGIKTVMGGGVFADYLAVGSENFNTFVEKTAAYIDKIIIGEGELLFLKLLQNALPGSQRVYTSAAIAGEHLELATITGPDLSDFNTQHYPYLVSYVSRSCPYQCRFCSETQQWGKYRQRSIERVVDELYELQAKYDSQLFLFGDSLLNPFISELAETMIRQNRDISLYWDGYLRVDRHVYENDNTIVWRRGGFYRARLGVESGSPHVLALMNKKITPGQIMKAVSALAGAGIKTTTYWIIGYPGETEEDFHHTLSLLEELKNDIYEAEARPFYFYLAGQPGSRKGDWHFKGIPLYEPWTKDMLLFQEWIPDCLPSRQEIHHRLNTFVHRCSRLGIPNPYSLHEIAKADERWIKLQKNAVPPLIAFKKKGCRIDENRVVKKSVLAPNTLQDNGDFNFLGKE